MGEGETGGAATLRVIGFGTKPGARTDGDICGASTITLLGWMG